MSIPPPLLEENRSALSKSMSRRNVVIGAAWSVPVTLVAAQVPAYAAASQSYVVQFDKPSYTTLGCSAISGASVTVKDRASSQPQAGIAVSLTLPTGLTFASGSKTFSGTTDGSGVVPLPAINTTNTGGTYTLTAIVSADSGSSSAIVNPRTSAQDASSATIANTYGSVMGAASAVGPDYFLTRSGDLYSKNTKVATGVIAAAGWRSGVGSRYVDYVTSAGGFRNVDDNTSPGSTFPNLPTNAVPIGTTYFLTPGGDLWRGNTKIASNIASARGWSGAGFGYADYSWCDVVDKNGVATRYGDNAIVYTYTSVPAGASALGAGYYLTPAGDLYWGNDMATSNIASAAGWTTYNNNSYATAVDLNGTVVQYANANRNGATANTYPGATAIGANYFLATNGDFYYFDETLVASGVTYAYAYAYQGTSYGNTSSTDGVARQYTSQLLSQTFTGVQMGSKPSPASALGAGYYLTPAGDLYWGNDMATSNIASAAGWTTYNNNSYATAVDLNGTVVQYANANRNGATANTYPGATAIGANYFLTTNGDYYFNDTLVDSYITSAYAYAYQGTSYGNSCSTDCIARQYTSQNLSQTFTGVQMGSKPSPASALGAGYYLTPAGDLYWGNDMATSNIASAAGWTTYNNNSYATAVDLNGTVVQFANANRNGATANSYPGATAIGADYFLATNGDYYFNDFQVASNVSSAYGYAWQDTRYGTFLTLVSC